MYYFERLRCFLEPNIGVKRIRHFLGTILMNISHLGYLEIKMSKNVHDVRKLVQ